MKSLLLSCLCFLILSCSSVDPSSPNVIIIFTDDQGYNDVGCFGADDIDTPHLDSLAKNGIKLTNFYAAQAVCSASRAALLTGCYPNRIGIHQALMPNAKVGLNQSETTIAEMLKDQGYATALFGKWHLGDHPNFSPMENGFDEYFGIPYSNDMWPYHPQQGPIFNFGPLPLYKNREIVDTLHDQSLLTQQITEHGVEFINNNSKNPFFLLVTHPQPHVPLFVSDRFKGKSKRGLYGDVIMEIDWSVGEIIKTLKENDILENTLVIFTSDNGPWLAYGNHSGSAYPLREGKGTALEGGQREPCIISYPGTLPSNKVIEEPMMTIDILPTIARITGATLPSRKIDGKDLWEVWMQESNRSPQEAYFFYYRVNELHGVRYKDWKLYFPHKYRTMNGKPGGMDGQPGRYGQDSFNTISLYNLKKDISEVENVASNHPAVVDTILQLAIDMREELGDALQGRTKGKGTREPGRVLTNEN